MSIEWEQSAYDIVPSICRSAASRVQQDKGSVEQIRERSMYKIQKFGECVLLSGRLLLSGCNSILYGKRAKERLGFFVSARFYDSSPASC